ncbi:MAG: polyamine aminopropyltransferase [Leptospiraceae bacterium]|nr:polyamine aminopropyltransferase [Leptospiraceae bacterium]
MPKIQRLLLLSVVVIISVSGLSYELVAGTMATYLLGQSVTQFSFATGWFLAAMGFGSYLSRFVKKNIYYFLFNIQILIAIIGGFSAGIMFFSFAATDTLYPIFIVLAFIIGSGIGLEIPILLRLMRHYKILSVAVSDVFTFDYIGALFASVLFPLAILPFLGLVRASIFFGFLNLIAAGLILTFVPKTKRSYFYSVLSLSFVLLVVGFIGAEKVTNWMENLLYQDAIVYSSNSKYQRIVITKWKDDTRLYLDGNVQFSTVDEAMYHEPIVHIPISFLKDKPKTALVLGGGDGLVIRELLKYESIETITLVELDPAIIDLFKNHPVLKQIPQNSLNSPKVNIVIADAFNWLKNKENKTKFDFIVADLPDPNSHSLGKLYTIAFYLYVYRHLENNGIFVTQSTSPTFAPDAYYCIQDTIKNATEIFEKSQTGWEVYSYHLYIPSFGDWGFHITGKNILSLKEKNEISVETEYLTDELAGSFFAFPKNARKDGEISINNLNNQILVKLYSRSWPRWYR